MKILVVLSSADHVPGTDRKTGTWLEELAAPYFAFIEAGATVTLSSVNGGAAPIDPWSEGADAQTEATRRFTLDDEAQKALRDTIKLSTVGAADFDAVFYSGGMGPVFDLSANAESIALIESTLLSGKPVAAVCHGLAALRAARRPDGTPIVEGRRVTGFSNSEERAAHGEGVVPFLIESELRRLGATYTSAADWQAHVVVDGKLITGQNPASSVGAAKALLAALA